MSFLEPLFVLGALAVSLPILFHLIRRSPRGRTIFSSLMFLGPSPPRVARRSRLDDLLLLLLRCAALLLIALAFTRPFVRLAQGDSAVESPARRIAILLDSSASMRRDDLWAQALTRLEGTLRGLGPADSVALLGFDDHVRTLAGFEETEALAPGERAAIVRTRAAATGPTWRGTDLGDALVTAAEAALQERSANAGAAGEGREATAQVVLITDLQRGSRLDALSSRGWPDGVNLVVERLDPTGSSNAGVSLLAGTGAEDQLRVRVSSEPDASRERFALSWIVAGQPPVPIREVIVPPGQVRVFPVTPSAAPAAAIVLDGDEQPFDDTCHVAARPREQVTVAWVGRDAPDDPEGLRYYAERALAGGDHREARIVAHDGVGPLPSSGEVPPRLLILAGDGDDALRADIARRVEDGATVLVVLRDVAEARSLETILGLPGLTLAEAAVRDYAMLGQLDFSHPLLAPFADPRFGDFTKIRFWRHRRLDLPASETAAVRVLARFDDGSPALLEMTRKRGRVLVLTSGWHPADSQLARSTKFVPILARLLEEPSEAARRGVSFHVGDPLPLPAAGAVSRRQIRLPDGSEATIEAGASTFDGTGLPGIYELVDGSRRYAVNLDPRESRTSPLDLAELERLGVRMVAPAESAEVRLRGRDTDLEGAQRIWRWLLLSAMGLLVVETWLAGRRALVAKEAA